MIFYFIATGNSLYVAKLLDKKCVSIAQAIHGNLHFKANRIGIVCLAYGHRHGGANELAKDVFEDSRYERRE